MRSPAGEAERVLVVGGLAGLAAGFRRGRRRRRRASRTDPEAPAPELPVTRMTVIRPGPFDGADDAGAWLGRVAGSEQERAELVAEAIAIVNRALHAHALAAQDPLAGGVSAQAATATRVGWGGGGELAGGGYSEAIEIEPANSRRNRTEALRPQERLAAALGGREPAEACETLLLRARADLDGGRDREAALQLRVGLEALLAEVGADRAGTDQAADLAALGDRRSAAVQTANAALAGELSPALAEGVTETLRLCERVLRRRRMLAT
ncbi:MAG: hypothetical protein ABI726_10345 [bacterium]